MGVYIPKMEMPRSGAKMKGIEAEEKIIRLLNEYHVKALNSPYVQKPWAWALYQTWKDIDAEEKPRGIVIEAEEKDDNPK